MGESSERGTEGAQRRVNDYLCRDGSCQDTRRVSTVKLRAGFPSVSPEQGPQGRAQSRVPKGEGSERVAEGRGRPVLEQQVSQRWGRRGRSSSRRTASC